MNQNKKYEKFIYIFLAVCITWVIVAYISESKEENLRETISLQNDTIEQLQEDIEHKDERIDELNSTIEQKDDEIDSLTSDNTTLEEIPIDLTDDTPSNKKEESQNSTSSWSAYKSYRESLKENTTINEVDKSELNNDDEFECDYILNKNTKKFHHTWCSSVNNMKKSNTKEFTGTREEVINMGYNPCKRCNP